MKSHKMKFTNTTLALAAIYTVLWTSGCASVQSDNMANQNCVKNHSHGYCLLEIASVSAGAKDITPDEAKLVFEKAGVQWESRAGFDGIQAGFAGLNFARMGAAPLPGLGWNGTGLMLLLGAFSDDRPLGRRPQNFIILTESQIINNDPYATVMDAMKHILSAAVNADSIVAFDELKKPTFGKEYYKRKYKLTGGKCGQTGCIASFFNLEETNIQKSAKIIDSPTWLDHGKAYVWNRWIGIDIVGLNGSKKLEGIKIDENIMKQLPPYFYRYIPGEVSIIYNAKTSYPLIK